MSPSDLPAAIMNLPELAALQQRLNKLRFAFVERQDYESAALIREAENVIDALRQGEPPAAAELAQQALALTADESAAMERLRRVLANYDAGSPACITSVYQPDPAGPFIGSYEQDKIRAVRLALRLTAASAAALPAASTFSAALDSLLSAWHIPPHRIARLGNVVSVRYRRMVASAGQGESSGCELPTHWGHWIDKDGNHWWIFGKPGAFMAQCLDPETGMPDDEIPSHRLQECRFGHWHPATAERVAELETEERRLLVMVAGLEELYDRQRQRAQAAEQRVKDALAFVRTITVNEVHARDDHSQNCNWCRLEKMLSAKGASGGEGE